MAAQAKLDKVRSDIREADGSGCSGPEAGDRGEAAEEGLGRTGMRGRIS